MRHETGDGTDRDVAASEPAEPRPKSGPAPRLDRDLISRTAVALVDSQGAQALSMRSVGAALGVQAMSLYRYVGSRDGLLDAVVETVLDGLYADPEVRLVPGDDLGDYLTRLAWGLRRMALAHPQVFPLVATLPPSAPWVRPPLRSLRAIDDFFAAMDAVGLGKADAVAVYRAFSSFLLGHLLLEVTALGVTTGPVAESRPTPSEAEQREALAPYEHLRALTDELAEDHMEQEFAESLAGLLVRLEQQNRTAARRSTPRGASRHAR